MSEQLQFRLKTGDTAPTFEALDIFGQPVRLSGRPVLLSFYRNSACALCNLRVHRLIQHYPQIQAQGVDLIAVFESPLENIRQYVGQQDAPFPIIADPTGELYNLYGVEVSEEKVNAAMTTPEIQQIVKDAAEAGFPLTKEAGSNFFRIPADFLITSDGKIHTAFYAERFGEHLPFEVIDAFKG